jgi:nitroreductase
MNPKLQGIFQRRSVRRYQAGDLPPSVLQDLLESAMAAPSACAKDPWHFVVVRDKATLGQVADGLPNGQMLREATAGIAVCGDPARAHDGQLSYLLQDCSAAIENLLIAASALGWGACWLGVHPREDRVCHLRQVLGIPETILPVAMIALGRPGEEKAARSRYDATRVHDGRW